MVQDRARARTIVGLKFWPRAAREREYKTRKLRLFGRAHRRPRRGADAANAVNSSP